MKRWMNRIFSAGLLLVVVAFTFSAFEAKAATYTWDGGGATNDWSECANWTSDTCPTSADIAVFDGTSTKDATVDASFAGSVAGLQINSGYTGTTTLARSLTVGSSNYTQADGVFALGSNTLTMAGADMTITGGTFNEGTGTVLFTSSGHVTVDVPTTETFYNLTFNKSSNWNLGIASGDTLVVTNNVTFSNSVVNTGDIDPAAGATVTVGAGADGGSANVIFNEAGDETIQCSGGIMPDLVVSKSSGTLDFNCSDLHVGNFTLQSGTFSLGTSTLDVDDNFTVTGGTFDEGTGTVTFTGSSHVTVDVPTTETFYNLTFSKSSNWNLGIASGDTLVVTNNTTFANSRVNTGTVEAQGDVSVTGHDGGSASLIFTGTSTQTFTLNSPGLFDGDITINKSGGVVNLGSALTVDASDQDLTIVEGILDISGFNLTESGSGIFTVQDGGTLRLQGGESVTNPTLESGSTVEYNGGGTYSSLAVGTSYDNLIFSGSGSWSESSDISLSSNLTQTAGTFTHTGTLSVTGTSTLTTTANTSLGSLSITGALSDATGYWKFDETSAGTFADNSGNGNTGTGVGSGGANNTPQPSADVPSAISFTNPRSLNFDGTDDYVSIPNGTAPTGDFTYAAWVKPTSFSGSPAIFMSPSSGGGNETGIYINTDGTMDVWLNGSVAINDAGSVSSDTWTHIALTRNGSAVTLWKNGSSIGTASDGTTLDFSSCPLYIGLDIDSGSCSSSPGNYFTGNIDDARVYNRALDSGEISSLVSGNEGTFDSIPVTLSGSGLDLSGNLTLNSGAVLDVSTTNCSSSSCNITIAGDWSNNGTFTARTGTVTFDGTNQSITGDTTWYNLTKTVSSADTLTFGDGDTQTVTNTWTAQGASGQLLSLRSAASGTQWRIDPQNTRTIEYLDVKDSNNTNATAITTSGLNVTNSGNNTNWTFNQAPDTPTSLGPTAYVDGSWVTDNTPDLSFTTADNESDNVSFHIQIDDSSDFSSPVVEYTSAFAAPGSSSFTVGQAAGSGTYQTGSEGQTLSDTSYYWRVQATDGAATSSYATANSGSIAFQLDATAPTTGTVTIGTTSTSSISVSISGASDSGSGLATTSYTWLESTSGSTTGATTTTTWTPTGLTPNTEHTFTVGVSDAAGNTATTTATSTYTLALPPSSAAAVADSSTQITLTWGAGSNPGTTEYYAENTTNGTNSGWQTSTSWISSGLTASTAYNFTVKARNGNNIETTSVGASATTGAESSTPTTGGGGGASKKPIVPPGLLKKLLPTDPGESLLIGPTKVKAGDTVTLSLLARSTLGTSVGAGGDTVSITVSGANTAYPSIIDNNNGSYTARYLAANDGTDTVSAYLNGVRVENDTDGQSDGTLHITVQRTGPPAVPPGLEKKQDQDTDSNEGGDEAEPEEDTPEVEPPEPFVIESGLTEACHRAFSWNRSLPATIYRKIGNGHDARVATINSATTWYVDVDPLYNNTLTYRFVFSPDMEETVTFSAASLAECAAEATASNIVEADVDNDGNQEQYIDGIYQDTDGSSVPLATVSDGLLLDTTNDGLPDTYWNTETGISPVIAAGDRLYITDASKTSVTMYEPYERSAYRVIFRHLGGGNVALAAEGTDLSTYTTAGILPKVPLPEAARTAVTSAGAVAGASAGLFSLLRVPFSVGDFGRVAGHLWSNLLGLVAFRRRRKPWGTVYDSVTKVPIDPAYVELFDLSGKKVAEAITDLDGRYGFLVAPGRYTIKVHKTNYAFPSTRLAGRDSDVLYSSLYFGGEIETTENGVVAHDIPIDPINEDWNQMDKIKNRRTTFTKFDPYIIMFFDAFFYAGLALVIWQYFSDPTPFATALLGVYAILVLTRIYVGRPRLHGRVTLNGVPLAHGIISFYNEQSGNKILARALDENGRYIAILPKNTYRMVVEKRTAPETYQPVFETRVRTKRGGVVNRRVEV